MKNWQVLVFEMFVLFGGFIGGCVITNVSWQPHELPSIPGQHCWNEYNPSQPGNFEVICAVEDYE